MLRPLTVYQFAKETTRGTAVPSTSKIAVESMEFTPDDEMARPNLAKGLILPHSANETPVGRGTTWRVPETPFVFNQHQHWMSMGIDGAVTATGASDPWTWTFTRSLVLDPAPDSWTIERRLSDGANFADNEFAYSLMKQISWTWETGQVLKFSAEGFSRRIQSSTLTPALAMPSIDIPAAPLGKVWLDSAWANLGTTLIAGQVRKIDITFKTGIKPVTLMDGRTDLDFSQYVIDANEVGTELALEVLLTKAQYDAQRAAAEAATLRAVRVKIDQSATRTFQVDMLVKHVGASMFGVAEADGQVSTTFNFQESSDGTNFFSAILLNGIGTYI